MQEQRPEFTLREGEGITGAAALAREAIAVSDTWGHPHHDRRADERLDFRTRSMVSAPILYGDILYGVINILNYTLGGSFPPEWEERLSSIGVMFGAALAAVDRLDPRDVAQEIEAGKKSKKSFPDPACRRIQDCGKSAGCGNKGRKTRRDVRVSGQGCKGRD